MPGRPADAAPAASTSTRVNALKLKRTCSRHSRPLPVTCAMPACTAAGMAAAPRSAAPGRAARAAPGRAVMRRSDMDTSLWCGRGGGAAAEGRTTGLLCALSPWAGVPPDRLPGTAAAGLLAKGAPVGLAVALGGPTGPAGSNATGPMLSPGRSIVLLLCSGALALRVCRCRYGATIGSQRSVTAPDRSRVESGTCERGRLVAACVSLRSEQGDVSMWQPAVAQRLLE